LREQLVALQHEGIQVWRSGHGSPDSIIPCQNQHEKTLGVHRY
jgi:hypothetical protein